MDKNWLAVHIFYSSSADPMLAECIKPMVEDLEARGLIRRHFFIKYWLEGPHVRLRLLPAEGVSHEQLKAEIEPPISAFLKRRPALYEQPEGMNDFYQKMFIAEYGEEAWEKEHGETGEIEMAPNNSFKYVPYEPEYGRYGGVEGIELSERHFQTSSRIVLSLLRDANVHVRTILMGLSTQLSLPMCYEFLRGDQEVIDFLVSYIDFWQETYAENTAQLYDRFDEGFEEMRGELVARCREIRAYALELPDAPELTSMEHEWLDHCRALRRGVEKLSDEGKLSFSRGEDSDAGGRQVDTQAALQILLSSYVHMTNNRLGVSILDEIYLSYQIKKALETILVEEGGEPDATQIESGRPPEASRNPEPETVQTAS